MQCSNLWKQQDALATTTIRISTLGQAYQDAVNKIFIGYPPPYHRHLDPATARRRFEAYHQSDIRLRTAGLSRYMGIQDGSDGKRLWGGEQFLFLFLFYFYFYFF